MIKKIFFTMALGLVFVGGLGVVSSLAETKPQTQQVVAQAQVQAPVQVAAAKAPGSAKQADREISISFSHLACWLTL
jgi:hypothetical protein